MANSEFEIIDPDRILEGLQSGEIGPSDAQLRFNEYLAYSISQNAKVLK